MKALQEELKNKFGGWIIRDVVPYGINTGQLTWMFNYQKINEVRICHDRQWAKKCLAGLKTAYAKAPFFEDHLNFLEKVFSENFERLIDLNVKLIRYLMDHLQIPAGK